MSTAAVQSAVLQGFASATHFSFGALPPSQPAGVHTSVTYVDPPQQGEHLYNKTAPAEGEKRTNFIPREVDVVVHDMRQSQEAFDLDRHGFELRELLVMEDLDWTDEQQIISRYYPLAEEAIKRASGATRVFIFDNTLRNGKIQTGPVALQSGAPAKGGPVPRVHVDYTVRSGPGRLHEVLPEEADKLKKTPFAIIQVWRPLKGPVDEAPLAVVDAQTTEPGDLLPVRLEFPHRTGYTYTLRHSPRHKFWYAKGMTTSEALLFKCYDSRKGTARFGPHTSFKDPNTPSDAAPRQSIELRAYAFFEDLPEQGIEHEL